jgi:hypothetical protein
VAKQGVKALFWKVRNFSYVVVPLCKELVDGSRVSVRSRQDCIGTGNGRCKGAVRFAFRPVTNGLIGEVV